MVQIFELLISDPESAIILWRSSDEFLELIVEVADVVVAEFHAYFGDGFVCADQKFLSRADFEPNQILSGGDAQNFLEVMTEARNAHVGEAAHLLDRDVLRKVCVDEVFAVLKRRVEISPLNDFFSRQLLQNYQQGVEQMVTCDARR